MHVKKVTQKDRYGNTMSYEFEVPEKGIDQTKLMEKMMDMSMEVPAMMDVPAYDHPGEPKGSDTVPAWLTPGEFVVNAEAMRMPGAAETVEAINDQGRAIQQMQGGSIPHYHDGGVIPAPGVSNPETDLGFPFPQRLANGGEITNVQRAARGWAPVGGGIEGLLHEREGFRPDVYLDTEGYPTVGYGHLIEKNKWAEDDSRVGTQPYSEAELKAFFDKDVQAAQSGAIRNIGQENWDKLNERQRNAMTSMAFQLGEAGQKKFGNMIKAIQAGDHERVAIEALTGSKPGSQSKWLKQTPKRAFDLAEAFHPGVSAAYKADGGVVYADDGGWKGWLNRNILGEKSQFDIPEVPSIDEIAMADTDYLGEAHPQEEYLRTAEMNEVPATPMLPGEVPEIGDPYDESSNIPVVDPVEVEEILDSGVETGGRGSGEYLDSADDRKLWEVENSDEYQAMVARARSAGVIPMSPEEWLANNTVTEGTDSTPSERNAPFSDTSAQKAAADTINNGGTAAEANAASNAAAKGDSKPDEKTKAETIDSLVSQYGGDDNPGTSTPTSPDTQTEEQVVETGKKDPKAVAEGESMLKGIFGDLFDKGELKRMAIMYAGSRLLGYGHGGSLQWAAKNYVNRVDAKVANRNKTAAEFAKSGKFTQESVAKYQKSGDLGDLISAGASYTPTGNAQVKMIDGQKVPLQEVKDSAGGVYYQAPNGRIMTAAQIATARDYEPAFDKGTVEYRERRNRARTNSKERFEEVWKAEDRFRVGENEWQTVTKIRPKQAADEFWAWSESMGLDPESDEALQIMTNAYQEAIADGKTGEVKPTSLKPYLENQYIRETTGAPELFITNEPKPGEKPKYVRGDKMQQLNRNVEAVASRLPGLAGLAPQDAASKVYDLALQDWHKLGPDGQKVYNKSASDGESGFYYYINARMAGLIQKL